MGRDFTDIFPDPLKARLNMIIQTVPLFWEERRYGHFTNHGPKHSARVQRKLEELMGILPESCRLTPDEVFILLAAAWLYDTGMQSPNLKPILDFDFRPDDTLSSGQLEQIRDRKHLLTEQLIMDCTQSGYQGPVLQLGLAPPIDEHTRRIAEVCRWCSDEPLEEVPDRLPVNGKDVHIRLLVALLRFADRLYIDKSRVNLDLLKLADLPYRQFARWWAYHYTQTSSIGHNQIRFHYLLPVTQEKYARHIRALIETDFEYSRNSLIRYLWKECDLHLMPAEAPTVKFEQPSNSLREMDRTLTEYLQREIPPMEIRLSVLPEPEELANAVHTTPPVQRIKTDNYGRGKMIKILFLAANPSDSARLRLDEESRAIDQALRQAEFRDSFDIKHHFAVRVADLQGYLLRHKPDIVHFSGHGSEFSEIVLEDNNGNSQPVSARALSKLFSVLKDNIRCVVLNACYSEPQAQAIAEHIDCVVGMSESIGDRAAVSFAASFYQALGFGRDVKTAFDLGCVQIDLESLDEQDIPILLSMKCDPKEVFFVSGA